LKSCAFPRVPLAVARRSGHSRHFPWPRPPVHRRGGRIQCLPRRAGSTRRIRPAGRSPAQPLRRWEPRRLRPIPRHHDLYQRNIRSRHEPVRAPSFGCALSSKRHVHRLPDQSGDRENRLSNRGRGKPASILVWTGQHHLVGDIPHCTPPFPDEFVLGSNSGISDCTLADRRLRAVRRVLLPAALVTCACCRMRSRSFSAGSSVGSWGTRRPSKARFKMPCRSRRHDSGWQLLGFRSRPRWRGGAQPPE